MCGDWLLANKNIKFLPDAIDRKCSILDVDKFNHLLYRTHIK